MKRILSAACLVLFSHASIVPAQSTTSIEEQINADIMKLEEQIKSDIMKSTTIKAVPIRDAAFSTCFAAEPYSVTIHQLTHGGDMSSKTIYLKGKNGMQEVAMPSTNANVPELLALFKPTFTLKTQADGATLLSAFKTLYTRQSGFLSEIEPKVVQSGTTWTFIMGKFFEKFSGFVIQTDSAGKVTQVKYSLEIPNS